MMAEFHIRYVIGNRTSALGVVRDFLTRHKDELGVRIDKFPDEPRTSDAIDLRSRACHPLHLCFPPTTRCLVSEGECNAATSSANITTVIFAKTPKCNRQRGFSSSPPVS